MIRDSTIAIFISLNCRLMLDFEDQDVEVLQSHHHHHLHHERSSDHTEGGSDIEIFDFGETTFTITYL